MAGFERIDANPFLCRIFAPEIDRICVDGSEKGAILAG
jgi:hypothetical protein